MLTIYIILISFAAGVFIGLRIPKTIEAWKYAWPQIKYGFQMNKRKG